MKKTFSFIQVFSLIFVLFATSELLWPRHLLWLDGLLSDYLVKIHARDLPADPDIVIISIDDASLAEMEGKVGKWVWPRSVHGEILEAIHQQGPKAIVFDLTFNEKDKDRPESDQFFNDAIRGKPNVFFPITLRSLSTDAYVGLLSDVEKPLGLIKTARADPRARGGFLPPFAIDMQSWQVGTINFNKGDGVGRRYDLYTDLSGWLLPSLPAKVMQSLGYSVPRQADMILSWRGAKYPFTRVSYSDLYADIDRAKTLRPPNEFRNKIVIIGADASSLHDIRPTPIDSEYSGLDILATAIDNLKNQRAMHELPRWHYLLVSLLLIAAIYLCFIMRVNALYPALAMALLTPTSILLAYAALSHLRLVHVLSPLLLIWSYYFVLALREYWIVHRSYQATIKEFGRYVNPHVVKAWVAKEGSQRVGEKAESREITVLFSDIRGFTGLSENRSPEEVVALLNRYFTLQVEVIFRFNGTVDKFIGDCIMAFWGAPLDNPHHARDAVLAAIEMSKVLEKFKAELQELEVDFDVGIGLHSGAAVVGSIGSEERKEFTAIGDTVNLASRIEGLTKGISRILVSKETMQLCAGALDFHPVGSYKVKGREQEVALYSPIDQNTSPATSSMPSGH